MKRLLFGSLQVVLLTTCAAAQSATDAVQEFRLIGEWAADCYQRPSPRNEHATFSKTTAGYVRLVNDFGTDHDNMVYRVVKAQRVSSERISLQQVLTTDKNIVLDVVLWKLGEKIRTWSSRMYDGTTLVAEGVVGASNGHESPWEGRCNERWATKRAQSAQ